MCKHRTMLALLACSAIPIAIGVGAWSGAAARSRPMSKAQQYPVRPPAEPRFLNRNVRILCDANRCTCELRRAVRRLKAARLPAKFYASIANNRHYTRQHRLVCAYGLFVNRVHVGETLRQLHAQVRGARWLSQKQIFCVGGITGWIPLNIKGSGSIYCISFEKNEEVYIQLSQSLDAPGPSGARFFKILKSGARPSRLESHMVIVSMGHWPNRGAIAEHMLLGTPLMP
jgi:hypothetical protein